MPNISTLLHLIPHSANYSHYTPKPGNKFILATLQSHSHSATAAFTKSTIFVVLGGRAKKNKNLEKRGNIRDNR